MQYINRIKSRKANNQRMKPCVHSPIRKSSVFGNEVDIETIWLQAPKFGTLGTAEKRPLATEAWLLTPPV